MKTFLIIVLSLLVKTSNNNDTGETKTTPVSYAIDLPTWLYDSGYIGISDPNKDTIVAYEQAVNRALALYALSNDVSFSSVYEYYYLNANMKVKNHENQKSHWIAEFETSIENVSYQITKTYRTKYNETIVMLSVSQNDNNGSSINISGSFMYHYDYLNNKNEYGEKQILEIKIADTASIMEWSSTISNNKYMKISSLNNSISSLKKISTSYNDYGNTTDEMVFSKIEFGLWNSFIDTFFQSLSIFEPKNIIIENTTRQITHEENGTYGDKNQNISRMVMKTNISCSLTDISLKNNVLYTKWEVIDR